MSQDFTLVGEDRTDQGKGASRRLRREGKVPGILYGGRRPPRALVLDRDALTHSLSNDAAYSSILTLTIGDKSQPCIVKDVQRHPARNVIVHIDLQRILEDEKIRVSVPIHLVGENVAPGVKQGGKISHVTTELEITCLPKDLPEYLEADVSGLEMDGILHVSELQIPEGVEIVAGEGAMDQPVATVHVIRVHTEEEEAPEGAAEVPPGEVPTGDESEADKE
jgi:large subunit ribosomal protein L25